MDQICGEKRGLLFAHKCKRAAVATCERCQKPVCKLHGRSLRGQLLCISCWEAEPEPDESYRGSDPFLMRSAFPDYYYYDPYAYSHRPRHHRHHRYYRGDVYTDDDYEAFEVEPGYDGETIEDTFDGS